MGWRNLFSSCAVVSVFCSGGKQVLVLHATYVLRVPYSCGVVLFFFGYGRKKFLVLCTYLVYNTVVRLCKFFCCGKKLIVYKYLTVMIVTQKKENFLCKKMIPYKIYIQEDQLFLALY
jgi:hypothetical protein